MLFLSLCSIPLIQKAPFLEGFAWLQVLKFNTACGFHMAHFYRPCDYTVLNQIAERCRFLALRSWS